jgi:hypothetical protein
MLLLEKISKRKMISIQEKKMHKGKAKISTSFHKRMTEHINENTSEQANIAIQPPPLVSVVVPLT